MNMYPQMETPGGTCTPKQKYEWACCLGPVGGVKYHLISTTLFKRFFYQTLSAFSQIKDTKHIRQNFHSVDWVMPQGWYFGALGVPRGSKKIIFKHGHVAFQIDGDDEQNRMLVKFSS